MGQKVNPTSFRLGINQKWQTEFFEKNKSELSLFIFKDLEINNYIQRFFRLKGLIVHDYKYFFNDSTLTVYISYFVTPEFVSLNKLEKVNFLLLTKNGCRKKKINETPSNIQTNQKLNNNLLKFSDYRKCYKILKYLKLNTNKIKKFISQKKGLQKFKYSMSLNILHEIFLILSLFMNNQTKIRINFSCLNKDLNFLKSVKKKKFKLLRRFRNTIFIKNGIELLFNFIHSRNSASLLSEYIANQIRLNKRHKFFLSFLKKILLILLSSSFSKIKGIKILIKGRLNGVPRAKQKTLIIGKVPVQRISENINFHQTTTTSSTGSYGIKVWVIEK